MLLLVACDTFREEVLTPETAVTFRQNSYFVLPGKSVVIDLESVIEHSLTSVSLTVSQPPVKGTLTQLDPFLLKYTPNSDFREGADQIVFSALLDNGSTLKSETRNIIMMDAVVQFPCDDSTFPKVYAVEDQVPTSGSGIVTIDPVRNDRVCEGIKNVSIYVSPKLGDAEIVGDSIIYRPGPLFSGNDELVYRLSSVNDEDVVYGIVSFQNWRIETFPLPPVSGISSSSYNDIVFVNENVGFITCNNSLLRTADGGRHWIPVVYPLGYNSSELTLFEELFFLDESTGFVAFSRCFGWPGDCDGGWLTTTDGGVSWERTNLDRSVTSIFFSSRSAGFISTTKTLPYLSQEQTILKTVDEGKTWETIATSGVDQDLNKIRIAKNEQDGYAFGGNSIHLTTDGGKSWTLSFFNERISSVAVTQDNAILASLNAGYPGSSDTFVSVPSRIVRCEDQATWTTVIDFQHPILKLGLSPSGDLGVALGVRGRSDYGQPGTANYTYIPTITASVDKGSTWKEIPTVLEGYPLAVDVPSSNVAYILFLDKIVKYYQY